MSSESEVRRYGVKEQTPSGDDLSRAVESLALVGYAIIDSGYSEDERRVIEERFELIKRASEDRYGRAALEAIDEHNTIRAPLSFDDVFMRLAMNERILELCNRVLSMGNYILNQQNGVINPPQARYNQGAYHRDLPYQHFVTSRPIAINALYCIDTFTRANGCTKVLPGSHKSERFPSDAIVQQLEIQAEASAGQFLVLDCMTYHCGGVNTTSRPRRAVNNVYTIPIIKQQISLPELMGGRDLPMSVLKLIGFDHGHAVSDIAAYYAGRRARVKLAQSI